MNGEGDKGDASIRWSQVPLRRLTRRDSENRFIGEGRLLWEITEFLDSQQPNKFVLSPYGFVCPSWKFTNFEDASAFAVSKEAEVFSREYLDDGRPKAPIAWTDNGVILGTSLDHVSNWSCPTCRTDALALKVRDLDQPDSEIGTFWICSYCGYWMSDREEPPSSISSRQEVDEEIARGWSHIDRISVRPRHGVFVIEEPLDDPCETTLIRHLVLTNEDISIRATDADGQTVVAVKDGDRLLISYLGSADSVASSDQHGFLWTVDSATIFDLLHEWDPSRPADGRKHKKIEWNLRDGLISVSDGSSAAEIERTLHLGYRRV